MSESSSSLSNNAGKNGSNTDSGRSFWLSEGTKDFVAGTFAGCAGVLTGHPFDTVKVRLQCQPQGKDRIYRGTLNCFATIIRKESPFGLYKGMASPMAGVAAINSLLFGVYGGTLRFLSGEKGEPSLSQIAMAGWISGTINSVLSCPIELMKTRLQMQGPLKAGEKPKYKGPWDCFRQTVRVEGIRGCYKGMTATVVREAPSYAAYFASYDVLCKLLTPEGKETKDLSPIAVMFAGGIGGIIAWLSSYPADVVKTRIQAEPADSKLYSGTVDCTLKSYRAGGVRVFFIGLNASIIRAFPVNGAIFMVYELVLRALDEL
eukprot:Nk52_evm4s123 gene=Nk52_evmTU4s123